MKLLTTQQMRALEQRADAGGNSYAQMMERAGTLTAKAMLERWNMHERRVLVLVGPGNNGGDGLVCARLLHDAGAIVGLYLWKRTIRDDDVNWRLCMERDINYARAEDDSDFAQLKHGISSTHFMIDAFLGTGVARPIEGLLKEILNVIKSELARQPISPDIITPALPVTRSPGHPVTPSPLIVAVDLPTGLNPDTGALDPAALPADLTVTFAFPKIGHYLFPGADAVGNLVVADIGIPRDWGDDISLDVATAEEIAGRLPARPRNSNKGTFGKALLACGSLEFTGAPALAAQAAGRVGAGLVTLALPRTIHPIVAAHLQEPTFAPLIDQNGAWVPDAVEPLAAHAQDYDALLIGCGFGRSPTTHMFVQELFGVSPEDAQSLPPLVMDADALNALSEVKVWWKHAGSLAPTRRAAPPILTPHPGEMARLLSTTIDQVQQDRIATAKNAAQSWNSIVVLKGAFTVIAAPDGRVTVIPFANSALATAGTGDVLAGTIVGLLAQYRAASIRNARPEGASNSVRWAAQPPARRSVPLDDAYDAAVVGAYIHGLAGELAAADIGTAGLIAGDLLERLPKAIRAINNRSNGLHSTTKAQSLPPQAQDSL